jgi:hypothetical protein
MENAKPGAQNAGHRSILIRDWKPLSKNTLRGFFSATLPSGLVLHDLMLHESNGKRWIGLPGKPYTDASGKETYAKIIDFATRAVADRFRDAVLRALDDHLAVR